MKIYVISLVALLVILAALFLYNHSDRLKGSYTGQGSASTTVVHLQGTSPEKASIEEYVTANIINLSPEKPQEGAAFTITSISTTGESGTVTYGDGLSTYIADFTYAIDPDFKIWQVTKFTVRPR